MFLLTLLNVPEKLVRCLRSCAPGASTVTLGGLSSNFITPTRRKIYISNQITPHNGLGVSAFFNYAFNHCKKRIELKRLCTVCKYWHYPGEGDMDQLSNLIWGGQFSSFGLHWIVQSLLYELINYLRICRQKFNICLSLSQTV